MIGRVATKVNVVNFQFSILNIREYFSRKESKYSAKVIMKWLWRAWRGNQLQAVLNASLGLLSVVVSLAQVWAIQHAIDVASHTVEGSLYWAVGYMGMLILANFAISISSIWVRNILGIRAQNRMQQRMLDRILRSEWHGKERLHSGDVINRLEGDVGNVVSFLTETLPGALSTLAMFLGAFFYLFSMDKWLAIIIIAMLPLFIAVSKVYVQQMRHFTRQVRDSDSKVQSVLQETVQNRMLIKTLESDTMMVDRLENTQSELRQNVVKRTMFSVFSNLILNFGFALGYLVAFLWSALRMSAGTLTFGGMTAFLQLVNRIQGPARGLTKLVPAFVRTGNKPWKNPTTKVPRFFHDIIDQWISDKGLSLNAWAVAYKIIHEGTKLYRDGGRDDIYSNEIPKTLESIGDAVTALYDMQITEMINLNNKEI